MTLKYCPDCGQRNPSMAGHKDGCKYSVSVSYEGELDWERWAREVCTDYRIPFDNHTVGLRLAIVDWMFNHQSS